MVRERVYVEEHVAATIPAEPAMGGRLGVEVADLLLALRDPKRVALDHGDKGHRPAADVGAVCAETVMNFKRRAGVLIAHRIGVATAPPSCLHALLTHCHSSFLSDTFHPPS